jgi:hypothetical protein
LADELVLPFLWAQDGFDQPSESMAKSIRFGLDLPHKGSILLGYVHSHIFNNLSHETHHAL